MKLADFLEMFESHVPPQIAADWDNVGLLVGSRKSLVRRVMTTLDVTEVTLAEAVERDVDLIVTHHPLPFSPQRRITYDDLVGRLLSEAMANRIAIYSPHTAWDNVAGGVNEQLADFVGLTRVQPLVPASQAVEGSRGTARRGVFDAPLDLQSICDRLRSHLPDIVARANMSLSHRVRSLAICCGSGGSMLPAVLAAGVDALLSGEATYHQCLQASQQNVAVLLIGHHPSESFSMRVLAHRIETWAPGLECWPAESDRDCMRYAAG